MPCSANETPHAQRVHEFMANAGQRVPETPCIPDEKTRILRAKLILEEALETVRGLGVSVLLNVPPEPSPFYPVELDGLRYNASCCVPNLEEIVDGCADISVVTIGTLLACGVGDAPILQEVDEANLRKFGPGGYRRDDGKWMKPADWTPPDIMGRLREQGLAEDVDPSADTSLLPPVQE